MCICRWKYYVYVLVEILCICVGGNILSRWKYYV